MKNLWAPWRMEYILSDKTGGCFLCEALNDADNPERLVIHRSETCFCVMNRYPYNNGHLLVAPNRHVGDLSDLDDAELRDLMRGARDMTRVLGETVHPHGFNLGFNLGVAAGVGLPAHLHMHVVPRWAEDTNFMPVVADTKVIVQALADLREQLIETCERILES